MCYPSYRAAVETEVQRRVQAGERFTAYDITRAVRAQGFRQPHRVLKEIVHAMHRYGQMGEYERTPVPVGSGGERAFLYHHCADSPRPAAHGSIAALLAFLRPPAPARSPGRFGVASVGKPGVRDR